MGGIDQTEDGEVMTPVTVRVVTGGRTCSSLNIWVSPHEWVGLAVERNLTGEEFRESWERMEQKENGTTGVY